MGGPLRKKTKRRRDTGKYWKTKRRFKDIDEVMSCVVIQQLKIINVTNGEAEESESFMSVE